MGATAFLKELLESGQDPNIQTEDGFVPLHMAAAYDQVEAARVLLAAGVDINACGGHQVTPLSIAVQNGSIRVTEELLQHSPLVDLPNTSGQSPLFAAAVKGFHKIFQALLDAGANIRLQQLEQNWTVLHLSAIHGQVEIVKEILGRYPKDKELLEAESANGVRPLLGAAASGQHEIAKLLLDAGADINAQDENGLTALRQAVQNSDLDMVKLLVLREARTDILSVNRVSLLNTARLLMDKEMIEFLSSHDVS